MVKTWVPHNYQVKALSFLLDNPRSALFLDPGLGKTSTSSSAIKILKNSGSIKGVLMVAPIRVVEGVWPQELEKWSNFHSLSCTILHGENKPYRLWTSNADIYLINPEGLPWLFEELLKGLKKDHECPFDVLWVDESTKFKNHESSRFLMLCDMLPLFKRVHIMTGTPSPKGLIDLWSQIYLLDEGKSLGHNFYRFRNKYFQADDWNKYNWYLKPGSDEEIHEAISHLVLDMSSEEYLDMPDLIHNHIKVTLPPKAIKYYKEMEKEFFIELDGMEASAEANAQASMKCHQIANGKVYEDIPDNLSEEEEREFRKHRKVLSIHTAKLDALQELIDELNGKPLLIAYKFRHDLEALQGLLGRDVPYIGSGVSGKRMNELQELWNARKLPILIGHPASMGHGLNLQQGGNDICWYSMDWNLEEYQQFVARLWRQGVEGQVRNHHLVAEGTIDEAMVMRLGDRADEQLSLRKALRLYRKAIS